MKSIKRGSEFFNIKTKKWQRRRYTFRDLIGADLIDTDLKGADLTNLRLIEADFRDADLTGANLSGAVLRWADLRGTCLRNANLKSADLTGARLETAYLGGVNIRAVTNGNNAEIKTIQLGHYQIVICGEVMAVGCQQYPIDEWLSFSDDAICMMDYNKSNDFLLDYYHNKLMPLLKIIRGEK